MAFGTLAIDTLSVSGVITGTAKSVDADYLATGSAKAWMHFDQTDSGHGADASLNISSITDSGAGRSDPVFTNAMSSIQFAAVAGQNGSTAITRIFSGPLGTAGGAQSFMRFRNASGADTDSTNCSQVCFGDLA